MQVAKYYEPTPDISQFNFPIFLLNMYSELAKLSSLNSIYQKTETLNN